MRECATTASQPPNSLFTFRSVATFNVYIQFGTTEKNSSRFLFIHSVILTYADFVGHWPRFANIPIYFESTWSLIFVYIIYINVGIMRLLVRHISTYPNQTYSFETRNATWKIAFFFINSTRLSAACKNVTEFRRFLSNAHACRSIGSALVIFFQSGSLISIDSNH